MLRKHIPRPVKNLIKRFVSIFEWDQYACKSWSQEGEDQILRRIFELKAKGFYVDIGAHHPKRFSNTYLFYKRGWSGINVDAMPGSMRAFNEMRPHDINLEVGIGEQEGSLDYFVFNEPALNGFSRDLSDQRNGSDSAYRIESIIKVDVFPLQQVLGNYLPTGQAIDFMAIDVEGFDFHVLKSNDWKKYRPTYVLVEVSGSSLHEIDQTEIGKFMRDVGYVLYAKSVNTVFFKESLYK